MDLKLRQKRIYNSGQRLEKPSNEIQGSGNQGKTERFNTDDKDELKERERNKLSINS